MTEHHRLQKEPPTSTNSAGATRSSRSSTLPSQESPRLKHRYRHRQHQSTSHKLQHPSRLFADSGSQSGPNSSEFSPLTPLGEIFKPSKRYATDGVSQGTGSANTDQYRGLLGREATDGTLIAAQELETRLKELGKVKRQRKAAESFLEDQYNQTANQTYEQHVALADSRTNALRNFGRLESTLASLSKLTAETKILLTSINEENIPELTEEARQQVTAFRATITDIESTRIAGLQSRVDAARSSTDKLGDRMGQVRARITVWEDREADEDRRRKRRVGFVWGTIATMFLIIVLLLIWGRVNERLTAIDEPPKDWTEIVIEKEMNRTGTNGSEIAVAELLRSLQEDEFRRSEHIDPKMPGEDATSENDDGRLASIFDEL